MGLVCLKCTACGASLEVDSSLEIGFCQYCGTKFILNEHININIKIDHDNESKILAANQYLQEGNFEKAEKIFKEVLENDIKNYQAWWGRYICESYYSAYYGYTNRYGETSVAIKKSIIKANLEYAYKAISYAPLDIQNEYKDFIASDEEFVKNNL